MGIGSGMVFLPSISVLSHYFRRRRAVVMGIVLSSMFESSVTIIP
jgi:hypothetical protein